MFTLLWTLLACRPDYALLDPKRSNLEEDEDNAPTEGEFDADTGVEDTGLFEDNHDISPDDIRPNMRIDAAIQHMGWGGLLTRCQVQVAFNRRWFAPPEEEGSQAPPPERPDEDGECIFDRRERPEPSQDPPEDNWYISGDLSGPETLYLHSLQRSIPLVKVQAEDGMIRYEMANCSQATFPFGDVFDLEIPESTDVGAVPAAYIEEVVAFGPNIQIETPDNLGIHQQYQGYASDGLYFSWSFDGMVPSLSGEVPTEQVDEQMRVQLINNSNQPWSYDESMECRPDTREELQLFDTDLLQFTLSQYLGEGIFSIGLNVHGDYYGPEREDPWGNLFRARVNIARGGMLELTE